MLGSHQKALQECARVLRPDGALYAHELVLTENCLARMPNRLREALVYHPWLFRHWDNLLETAGLRLCSLGATGRRVLLPGESPLAADAAMFSAEIEVERILVVAHKS